MYISGGPPTNVGFGRSYGGCSCGGGLGFKPSYGASAGVNLFDETFQRIGLIMLAGIAFLALNEANSRKVATIRARGR